MIPLVIYGCGGQAREVFELARCMHAEGIHLELLGWLDDDPAKRENALKGLPVFGSLAEVQDLRSNAQVTIAIGNPVVRRRVAATLDAAGIVSPILVHPRAWIARDATLAAGTQVMAGAMLSSDVNVGPHTIVNQGCTVAHDVQLGAFATLAPGVRLSGAVIVGEGADIGAGTTTVQGIRIGAWSIVGAGAAVVRDLPPNVTAVGVPARVIKERPPGWHLKP